MAGLRAQLRNQIEIFLMTWRFIPIARSRCVLLSSSLHMAYSLLIDLRRFPMANVNVTYEEMTAAANRLMTGEQDITTQLNELKSYIGNLVSSGFVTDQASVKFNETYTNFTTSATQTIGALDGLAQYLTQAAQAMQETDSQLAAGLGQ